MPVLPTVTSFGPRPAPRSQRGVVPVRAGIAESAEARGFRQTAQAAGGVANIAFAFAEKFAREDAEREARDLDTEFSNSLRLLQFGDGTDANPGFLNLKGQAALDSREAHIEALENLQASTLKKTSSDRVRGLLAQTLDSRSRTALDKSAAHFGRQREVANKASFDAHQAAIADDAAVAGAAGDAEGFEMQATLAGANAAKRALDTGADPALATEAAITKILTREIERRALIDPASAREFFEKHRDDIDGRKHNTIEAKIISAERQALKDLDKADREAEKVLREAQDVRAAELTDGVIEGTTNDADLDAALASGAVRGGQFISLRKLLKAQEKDDAAEDDPNVVLALDLELDQGVLTVPAVRAAYADKLITKSTMDGLVRQIDAGPQDIRIKRQRGFLRDTVGGIVGPLAILDSQASRRVVDALDEFDQRTTGPNAEDPRNVRLDIEKQAAQVRKPKSFRRPRFMVDPKGGDNRTFDIRETRKATSKALRAGKITPAQAAREFELIKDIEAARPTQ